MMGTLYDQPPRESRAVGKATLADRIAEVKAACKEAGIKPSADAILAAAQDRYRLAWWIDDRDIHDEQVGGIGNELAQIGDGLHGIAGALSGGDMVVTVHKGEGG
jgi:hypothetical protein